MELVNRCTRKCKGNILLFDNPFEKPTATPVTIHVNEGDWEMMELIDYAREKLINGFRDDYDQTRSDSLIKTLGAIDECVFTIAAYGRTDWHSSEAQEQEVSTRNLSAVVDRLSNMIVKDLFPLIVDAEVEKAKEEHRLTVVPLLLSAYANAVWHYALNSTSCALRVQYFRNTLLVMADGLRPDAS